MKKILIFFLCIFLITITCDDNFEKTINYENSIPLLTQSILFQENTVNQHNDEIPPQVGNSGKLQLLGNYKNFRIRWHKATDNITLESDLQYKVFLSEDSNISIFKDAILNGVEITNNWTIDFDTIQVFNLEEDKTYWFNVFVRDESNNISAYVMENKNT